MHTKHIIILLFVGIAAYFSACNAGGNFTGREYMPDMAHSKAYEPYTTMDDRSIIVDGEEVTLFKDNKVAREPVAGTIPRGHVPYHLADTPEDYERSAAEITNPYANADAKLWDAAVASGKAKYDIYCAICHGEKGKGNGTIVENGKYPAAPPSYFGDVLMTMAEGKMFHSIHYGKNMMGSYASQLNKNERWQVISYIRDMQADDIAKSKKISKAQALQMISGTMSYDPKATYAAAPAAKEEAAAEEKTEGDNEH